MKKIFLAVSIALLLFVSPAAATIVYMDLVNGDDGTGDGSYGNPYKTLNTAGSGLSGGDEVRVAKKDTHVALSGTLTFTNGSTTVNTTSDLTSEVAAGDFIGQNIAGEGWWQVASRDASSITLEYQYWGTAGSGKTGYSADYYTLTANTDMQLNVSGTSRSSRLTISGGWDLSTQTQTGKTTIYNANSYYIPYTLSVKDYIIVSDFNFLMGTSGGFQQLNAHGKDFNYEDINVAAGVWSKNTEEISMVNVIFAGGGGIPLNFQGVNDAYLENVTAYSCGDSWIYRCMNVTTARVHFKGLYLYNSNNSTIEIGSAGILIGSDLVIDTTIYSGSDGIQVSSGGTFFIDGIDISNAIDDGIYTTSPTESHAADVTFSSNGGDDIYLYVAATASSFPVLFIRDYGGTANDDRIFFQDAGRSTAQIFKDSTDARSGYCLKFDPDLANDPLYYKLGTAKVSGVATDMTLSVYMKDDVSFNGEVFLYATQSGEIVERNTYKTMTTSYAESTLTVAAADLDDGEYVELWIGVTGTAGNVFVDDFSFSR